MSTLTMCVKKGKTVSVGDGTLAVDSITDEGFVLVSYTSAGGEQMHVLKPETPTGGLQHLVTVAEDVRVGLSSNQPSSCNQCRVVFKAPRCIKIWRNE